MKAFLILEDGTVFEGIHIGADKEIISEIVFNTSMAGYLEVLTDPSYAGQAVCMTYPLIGNYGVIEEDFEGNSTLFGYIVRDLCDTPSNFRSAYPLNEYLVAKGIPGLCGVDTREIVRITREEGVRLRGDSDGSAPVYAFKDALDEMGTEDGGEKVFKVVNLGSMSSQKDGRQKFDLECKYEEAEE